MLTARYGTAFLEKGASYGKKYAGSGSRIDILLYYSFKTKVVVVVELIGSSDFDRTVLEQSVLRRKEQLLPSFFSRSLCPCNC